MSNQIETTFQVQLENRDRATAFARIVIAFPVFIFVSSFSIETFFSANPMQTYGLVVLPVVLALLFRGVYPSYVLSFNKALFGLVNRVWAYIALLTDEYPSIEDSKVVQITYPEVNGGKSLSRGLPLIKWIFAIPLYIVGVVYLLISLFVTVIAWVQTSITGKYPRWAGEIVFGTIAYWNRVQGYMLLLVTDKYPTFKLK